MNAKNPHFKDLVAAVFSQAGFVRDLGIELVDVGPGWCETRLLIAPRHGQQNGFVHAGVQATMADHTAGGAAASLVAANEYILTFEFKINLLRAAQGERLFCRAEVLKPGKNITVVESSVFVDAGDRRFLASKATVTLAVLQKTDGAVKQN